MTDFKQIDVEGAKKLIDAGNLTIADIRDMQSYSEAHIPGAVSVSDENFQDFIKTTDKNKPLICYCYHGISSQGAAQFFKQSGFADVYSIQGGFEEWRGLFPTASGDS